MRNGNFLDGVVELIRLWGRWQRKNEIREIQKNPKKWIREHSEPPLPLFTGHADNREKQKGKQASAINPGITLIKTPEENHAYHFKALMNLDQTNRYLVYEMTKAVLITKPIKEYENTAIRQLPFQQNSGHAEALLLRVITINDEQETVFPYLKTELKIPFRTERIIEWDIDDPAEAEIEGVWDGVASLVGFFASDYAVNKHIYQSKQDINLRLSAFVIDIDEIEVEEYVIISDIDETVTESDDTDMLDLNENEIDEIESNRIKNICEYWPNEYYGKYSYFDFEALVLDITKTGISKYSTGHILRLQITDNKQPVDLIVDAYVNCNNNTIQRIEKDIRITGTLWFQGEIAE
jgi:hypothetical protein